MNNLDPDAVLAIVIGAIVAVHVVFGIISARVASGKGRSPDLGFLAGFLLNIFGLIIVMLMRPSIEAEARRRIQVEREYKRQRRSGTASVARAPSAERRSWRRLGSGGTVSIARAPSADGHQRVVVPVRRARYGDVVDLRFVVLSTPDQRADGLSLLSEFVTGVLYFWPEGGTHQVNFLNPYSGIDLRVAIADMAGEIVEILTLDAGDDSAIEPTNPVASAIAFRAGRFESLGIDIGDKVVLPRELRPLIWDFE